MNIRKRASDLWTSLRYDGVHTDMSDTRKHVDRIAEALAAVERETWEAAAVAVGYAGGGRSAYSYRDEFLQNASLCIQDSREGECSEAGNANPQSEASRGGDSGSTNEPRGLADVSSKDSESCPYACEDGLIDTVAGYDSTNDREIPGTPNPCPLHAQTVVYPLASRLVEALDLEIPGHLTEEQAERRMDHYCGVINQFFQAVRDEVRQRAPAATQERLMHKADCRALYRSPADNAYVCRTCSIAQASKDAVPYEVWGESASDVGGKNE